MQKSFLKWPGNKYKILESIIKLLPKGKRYIEPFVGSGVVFLNVDYPKKIVADCNPDLINLYHVLIDRGDSFIEYAKSFFTDKNQSKEKYMEYRELLKMQKFQSSE